MCEKIHTSGAATADTPNERSITVMRRLAILMVSLLLLGLTQISPLGLGQDNRHKDVQTLGSQENACWQKAMTQSAMDECAWLELSTAEKKMDDTLRQVLANFSNDVVKTKAIKAAQAAWMAYRDAEANALFPPSEEEGMGSAHVMCRPLDLAELTRERTKELRQMLEHKEGDVCSQ
jgi:uncharacterized protein YecT (DUF1311 family)